MQKNKQKEAQSAAEENSTVHTQELKNSLLALIHSYLLRNFSKTEYESMRITLMLLSSLSQDTPIPFAFCNQIKEKCTESDTLSINVLVELGILSETKSNEIPSSHYLFAPKQIIVDFFKKNIKKSGTQSNSIEKNNTTTLSDAEAPADFNEILLKQLILPKLFNEFFQSEQSDSEQSDLDHMANHLNSILASINKALETQECIQTLKSKSIEIAHLYLETINTAAKLIHKMSKSLLLRELRKQQVALAQNLFNLDNSLEHRIQLIKAYNRYGRMLCYPNDIDQYKLGLKHIQELPKTDSEQYQVKRLKAISLTYIGVTQSKKSKELSTKEKANNNQTKESGTEQETTANNNQTKESSTEQKTTVNNNQAKELSVEAKANKDKALEIRLALLHKVKEPLKSEENQVLRFNSANLLFNPARYTTESDLAKSLTNKAIDLDNAGQYYQALDCYQQAIKIKLRHFAFLTQLGSWGSAKNMTSIKNQLSSSLHKLQHSLGISYYNVAHVYAFKLENLEKGLFYILKALPLYEAKYNNNHINLFLVYYYTGLIYSRKKELSSMLTYFEFALTVIEKNLDANLERYTKELDFIKEIKEYSQRVINIREHKTTITNIKKELLIDTLQLPAESTNLTNLLKSQSFVFVCSKDQYAQISFVQYYLKHSLNLGKNSYNLIWYFDDDKFNTVDRLLDHLSNPDLDALNAPFLGEQFKPDITNPSSKLANISEDQLPMLKEKLENRRCLFVYYNAQNPTFLERCKQLDHFRIIIIPAVGVSFPQQISKENSLLLDSNYYLGMREDLVEEDLTKNINFLDMTDNLKQKLIDYIKHTNNASIINLIYIYIRVTKKTQTCIKELKKKTEEAELTLESASESIKKLKIEKNEKINKIKQLQQEREADSEKLYKMEKGLSHITEQLQRAVFERNKMQAELENTKEKLTEANERTQYNSEHLVEAIKKSIETQTTEFKKDMQNHEARLTKIITLTGQDTKEGIHESMRTLIKKLDATRSNLEKIMEKNQHEVFAELRSIKKDTSALRQRFDAFILTWHDQLKLMTDLKSHLIFLKNRLGQDSTNQELKILIKKVEERIKHQQKKQTQSFKTFKQSQKEMMEQMLNEINKQQKHALNKIQALGQLMKDFEKKKNSYSCITPNALSKCDLMKAYFKQFLFESFKESLKVVSSGKTESAEALRNLISETETLGSCIPIPLAFPVVLLITQVARLGIWCHEKYEVKQHKKIEKINDLFDSLNILADILAEKFIIQIAMLTRASIKDFSKDLVTLLIKYITSEGPKKISTRIDAKAKGNTGKQINENKARWFAEELALGVSMHGNKTVPLFIPKKKLYLEAKYRTESTDQSFTTEGITKRSRICLVSKNFNDKDRKKYTYFERKPSNKKTFIPTSTPYCKEHYYMRIDKIDYSSRYNEVIKNKNSLWQEVNFNELPQRCKEDAVSVEGGFIKTAQAQPQS